MQSTGWRTCALAVLVIALAVAGEWFLAALYGKDEVTCEPASVPASLPALPEVSGIAPSRRTPGLIWAIHDSPPAVLYGVSENGDVRTRVQLAGADVVDWEAVTLTACPAGTCVLVADIGDNDEQRETVRVYRIPEPGSASTATSTATADMFDARYPDRPHDAEALFALPDGTLFLITKEEPGGTLYRFPRLEPGRVLTLERVATLPIAKVTDAAVSADGERLAVRTNDEVVFYRTRELLNGDVEHGAAVQLRPYNEPQGEGIAFGENGSIYLASEGGEKDTPGMLIQIRCATPNAS